MSEQDVDSIMHGATINVIFEVLLGVEGLDGFTWKKSLDHHQPQHELFRWSKWKSNRTLILESNFDLAE